MVLHIEHGLDCGIKGTTAADSADISLSTEIISVECVALAGLQDGLQLGNSISVFLGAQYVRAVPLVSVQPARAPDREVLLGQRDSIIGGGEVVIEVTPLILFGRVALIGRLNFQVIVLDVIRGRTVPLIFINWEGQP